jgi:demethylmenaquinone methyltransferase/2-methoxy-6-polyprenyl-1,4-benzoquinol methylase
MSAEEKTVDESFAQMQTERVHVIFTKIAQRYELFNTVSSFGACKVWLAKLVDKVPVKKDTKVLDIAGGTGDVSFELARKKHPASIVCSDLGPAMLEVARGHYLAGDSCGVPVTFAVVDAQDILFEDASFDVVTVAYGIRNMPDREKALSEMYRVLKPGGTLVCLEFSRPQNKAWRGLYSFYLKHLIPFWGRLITKDLDSFIYLGDSIRAFPPQEEFAGMLKNAGFKKVEWTNLSGGIAAIHTGVKEEA